MALLCTCFKSEARSSAVAGARTSTVALASFSPSIWLRISLASTTSSAAMATCLLEPRPMLER
jgi:hypothetical protein